jgi:hypothetical protein
VVQEEPRVEVVREVHDETVAALGYDALSMARTEPLVLGKPALASPVLRKGEFLFDAKAAGDCLGHQPKPLLFEFGILFVGTFVERDEEAVSLSGLNEASRTIEFACVLKRSMARGISGMSLS